MIEPISSSIDLLMGMMEELWAVDAVPFDQKRSQSAALRLLEEPRAVTIFLIRSADAPAEAAAKVCGYLVQTNSYSLEFNGRHAFIDELFVSETHRGRGLVTAAVHFAMEYCRERGMSALLLEANLLKDGATRLYRGSDPRSTAAA